MKRIATFPPGIGWLPYVVAVALAVALAVLAIVPQFRTQKLGIVTGPGTTGANPAESAQNDASKAALGPNAQPGGGTGSHSRTASASGTACAPGRNGGSTAPGVDATSIHLASTIVTGGVGADFLREAVDGMHAAANAINNQGGICGRRIVFGPSDQHPSDYLINDNWDSTTGGHYISNFINSGQVFALVGEPDSEGLGAAIDSGDIDRAGMPVVGTDGMLKDQYFSSWVWPVAAATVTNMHIVAKYAYDHGARSFGIVYDERYKFGKEGAFAFDQEVKRLTGKDIAGYGQPTGCSAGQAYCGISPDQPDYTAQANNFDAGCQPCDAVVLLLEPGPATTWMKDEENAPAAWYKSLYGGEPLFDDKVGESCGGCGAAKLTVWTGYQPAIQPFDAAKAVYTYCQSLHSVNPSDDCHNEFTEGAYLGTELFITAAQRVGPNLTRQGLKAALDSGTFDLGLSSAPLRFASGFPHLSNAAMAAFSENYSGSFNGWSYDATGFIPDPNPTQDFR